MINSCNRRGKAKMATRQKTHTTKQALSEDATAVLQQEACPQDVTQVLAGGGIPKGTSPDYFKVINYVRKFYLEFRIIPPIRLVIRRTGISLRCLHELFPQGYTKEIYKSVGIPTNAIRIAHTHHAHSG